MNADFQDNALELRQKQKSLFFSTL